MITTRHDTFDGVPVRIDEPDQPLGTIVLLHGWPDTEALWDDTVRALASRWRCVRFTLPGFAANDPPGAHSLDDVVDRLHRVVQRADGGRPVTLLLHDWGCLFGYHLLRQHPEHVARVIGVDVGDAASPAHRAGLDARARFGIVSYQWWLALAWRIGGRLGDAMARHMARKLHVPAPASQIRAQMGYPYWITWTGLHGSYRAVHPFSPGEPAVPMCFLYGSRKPFLFHSEAWAAALAERPGCRVVPMSTGHWVMLDAPQAFQAAVLDWLSSV
jgi:cis-3-alkyl-4-acyloxetan-2-one decarboxylase